MKFEPSLIAFHHCARRVFGMHKMLLVTNCEDTATVFGRTPGRAALALSEFRLGNNFLTPNGGQCAK